MAFKDLKPADMFICFGIKFTKKSQTHACSENGNEVPFVHTLKVQIVE